MNTSWKESTCGGSAGHRLRRMIHALMFLAPWVYFLYGFQIASWFRLSPSQLVILVASLVTLFECIRLRQGWVFFGQRVHEQNQLSSLFWGVISIALVLIFSRNPAYYIPIITVCSWVDPLLGELRAKGFKPMLVFFSGLIVAWVIWLLAHYFLGASLLVGTVCAFLAVFFEKFNWRWVDDNALMQLTPLLFYMLVFRVY
jgi:hypothetical protein